MNLVIKRLLYIVSYSTIPITNQTILQLLESVSWPRLALVMCYPVHHETMGLGQGDKQKRTDRLGQSTTPFEYHD